VSKRDTGSAAGQSRREASPHLLLLLLVLLFLLQLQLLLLHALLRARYTSRGSTADGCSCLCPPASLLPPPSHPLTPLQANHPPPPIPREAPQGSPLPPHCP